MLSLRLIVVVLVFYGLTAVDRTEAAPRNVVVIVADDMGLDAGCYGDKIARTPNIDALAREGTRFEFAFCTVLTFRDELIRRVESFVAPLSSPA